MSKKPSESCDVGSVPSNPCFILMTKYPEIGLVKRRLAEELAEEIVVDLYRCFVLDSIATLRTSGIPFSICYHPRSDLELFKKWLGADLNYLPQHGYDLGARLKNSVIDSFEKGFDSAIAIGSDSPDLPVRVLLDASAALRSYDAVIGPSMDGGFYLIGFTCLGYRPGVFDGIPWSTPEVFKKTAARMATAGQATKVLQRWRDVDTMEDLRALYKDLNEGLSSAPITLRFIHESKVLLE